MSFLVRFSQAFCQYTRLGHSRLCMQCKNGSMRSFSVQNYGIKNAVQKIFPKRFEQFNLNNIESHFFSLIKKRPRGKFLLTSFGLASFSLFGWNTSKPDEFNLKFQLGRVAETENRLSDAEVFYHDALKMLDSQLDQKVITEKEFIEKRTVTLDAMANLALMRKKFRDAEMLFKDTLKGMFVSGLKQDDNAVIEISIKLANIYALQKRHPEAVAGYRFCIESMEEKMNKDSDDNSLALWGLCLDSYARYLSWRGDNKGAEILFSKALELCKKVKGENDEQTLVILNSLASVAAENRDYKKATTYLENAINVGENIKAPELAAYYCNLGAVLIMIKDFDKALESCQKSETLAKKLKDKNTESEAKKCMKEVEYRRENKFASMR